MIVEHELKLVSFVLRRRIVLANRASSPSFCLLFDDLLNMNWFLLSLLDDIVQAHGTFLRLLCCLRLFTALFLKLQVMCFDPEFQCHSSDCQVDQQIDQNVQQSHQCETISH